MRLILRLLLVLMLIAAAACGQSAAPEVAGQEPGRDATRPANTGGEAEKIDSSAVDWNDAEQFEAAGEFMQPWVGDLDGMEKRRVIRILSVYSVGSYYIDQGQEKGLTKELARLFEHFINKRVQGKQKIYAAIIPVARDQLIPALLAGRGDLVVANLSITPEREELIDFSIPVSKPLREILVTGPSAPGLESIDDLAGKTLYVRHSSSYRESVEQLNTRLAQAGKAPVKIRAVDESLEDVDLIEMVNTGLLPWAIIDDYKLNMWKDMFASLQPRPDIVFREGARIAWAMRPDSPQLEEAVNAFLKKNRAGTLVGNVLINRYVNDFDWADNALSTADYALFKRLAQLFEKYGETYEIDYLLAVAQGYQESRLNQSARSHTGAIGIMQMLPATAGDPNVNISDIEQTENNIHAGMKYLNFLRQRYFSDPGIDHTNRTLMALAAYNAGPARMINLRARAAKLGYDPNVWFDNVELVAARDVGREPVTYVANIVKYYTAYRHSVETLAERETARQEAGID